MDTMNPIIAERGNFDEPSFIEEQAQLHARLVRVGIQSERERLMPLLRAITAAYKRALSDPKSVIPSLLMAAIEVAQLEVDKK